MKYFKKTKFKTGDLVINHENCYGLILGDRFVDEKRYEYFVLWLDTGNDFDDDDYTSGLVQSCGFIFWNVIITFYNLL